MYKFLVNTRSTLLVWLTHSLALPILKLLRKPEKFPFSQGELQKFPDGSMGKTLLLFLDSKDLQLLPYYARHDIKHILLDYDTTDEGEGCLQCFMLGNGHVSFPVLATVVYCFVTMPEYWTKFRQAYRRGKKSPSLEHIAWFNILDVQVTDLKKTFIHKE